MHRNPLLLSAIIGAALATLVTPGWARDAVRTEPVEFSRDVLPIFARACFDCHGPDAQESTLRLDVQQAALAGGELFGPAIIPGDADGSPLVRFISADGELTMPPGGAPLSDDEVALIRRWIDAGASWPGPADQPVTAPLVSSHWSLQPLAPVVPPNQGDPWIATEVDAFVLAKLRDAGLAPSPPADRRRLIRRLYFDMHGLPPTPEEAAAFIADERLHAYAELVERVLASPRYGERWAQHWLDVVRFAESSGFETNLPRPNAWPYRDYVIAALNDDKPYDHFIAEQIAGDALGEPTATGFLVAGAWDQVKSPDVGLTLMQRQDELADMVNATGTALLGMTVGCARCHNHKFDPILQKDFYALQAVFAGVYHGETPWIKPEPPADDGLRRAVSPLQNEERFEPIEARAVRLTVAATNNGIEPCLDELEAWTPADENGSNSQNVALAERGGVPTSSSNYADTSKHRLSNLNDGKYGNDWSWIAGTNGVGWAQVEFAAPQAIDRVVWGRDRLGGFADRLAVDYRVEVLLADGQWREVASSATRRPYQDASAMVYAGTFTQPAEPTRRLYRGDPLAPKEAVAPDALSVLGSLGLAVDAPEQQRRLALARWIASPENPLTARVIVNRIWQYHFGVGLVDTPSDFGANGSSPSHPELLDWLARQFIARGWSIKELHRLILVSSAYRQSSDPRADCLAVDADSRLLWRYPPRRLESEAIRDSMLQIAGTLDLGMGGPGWHAFEPNDNYVRVYEPKSELGPPEWRRMIYMHRVRMRPEAVFGAFDAPDGGQVCPKRGTSITAIQALNLFNSRFTIDQAEHFAARLRSEAGAEPLAQIDRAFQLAFNRDPDATELAAAQQLIATHGLPTFCRSVLNANELMFVP
jgi:mono/diheme cytochrome c family protein